ncbi:hypothetical protein HL666_01420 [Bradyrhizobium sp. 83002]|uniref:hypothetical protein n=1 Tax=Bradyrhizobium aeschynomenes TaxID=2734909 RepID=UPI001553030D|nr:hypothetical protein [Bradyrhizobium aeschynomenes]NPU09419.1 hypothetical protein [Bradyrhizobium aeschynomenes]
MINRFRWMLALGMAAATGFVATQALAQTDAQRNAIKSACRSDYMSKCSSVPPGGAAAFQCLQKNMASLSSSCQTAVKALEPAAEAKPAADVKPAAEAKPAPQPAASKPAAAEASQPAEPPKTAAQPAPAQPATAKSEPAKPVATAKPSEAQVAAIRSACSGDYRKVCSSVPPGGSAALQCLEQNKAKVSASCAQAIAGAGGTPAAKGVAVAAAPTAPAAAAPAPAAPAMVLRPLRPLEELRIVRAACGSDARAYCSGIEPGGGRIAQCLAANAGSLSPNCKGMLAQFAANR